MTRPTREPLVKPGQTARYWEEREFDAFLADMAARIKFLANAENFKPMKVGATIRIRLQSRFDA